MSDVSGGSSAIALVETRGLVALACALEAMQKATGVELLAIDRVGGGVAFAAVRGSTAAIRSAVDIAESAARPHSERVGVRMYVRPASSGAELLRAGRLPIGSDKRRQT